MIEGKQDDLIRFLEARFGSLEERTMKKIRATKAVAQLNELIRQSATVDNAGQITLLFVKNLVFLEVLAGGSIRPPAGLSGSGIIISPIGSAAFQARPDPD